MVELRWLCRHRVIGPTTWETVPETVLQYRVAVLSLDAGGALTPCPLPMEWHDWKDVPYEATPAPPWTRPAPLKS